MTDTPPPGTRQQILELWLHHDALDSGVCAWAFYDGTRGVAPLPQERPPYATGVDALADGWFLLQAPGRVGLDEIGGVPATRYVFERRIG